MICYDGLKSLKELSDSESASEDERTPTYIKFDYQIYLFYIAAGPNGGAHRIGSPPPSPVAAQADRVYMVSSDEELDAAGLEAVINENDYTIMPDKLVIPGPSAPIADKVPEFLK